jgi:hypothetical protein
MFSFYPKCCCLTTSVHFLSTDRETEFSTRKMEGNVYSSTGVHNLTFHFHTQQQEDGDNYIRDALVLRILHSVQNSYIKEDVMSGKCSVNW